MAVVKDKQKSKADVGGIKEYKVVGERFKSKADANQNLKKIFEKGFKGAGLLVQESEFVILYGSYNTMQIAKATMETVKKQGFLATIAE